VVLAKIMGPESLCSSAAKPDPFFGVEPDFGPKIRVESGRVGPHTL
jgi:hypothetical protein